jgi:hypothetical protein
MLAGRRSLTPQHPHHGAGAKAAVVPRDAS